MMDTAQEIGSSTDPNIARLDGPMNEASWHLLPHCGQQELENRLPEQEATVSMDNKVFAHA